MDKQLVTWLKKAGFKGEALKTMYGIVKAESGGNPHAYNGKGQDRSYGLAQINMLGKMGEERARRFKLSSYDDLYDPIINLRAAYRISSGGKNFKPWTTYVAGKHVSGMQELERAGIDVDAVEPIPDARRPTQTQSRQRLSPQDLEGFDHRGLAIRSLGALARGDYDPMEGLGELIQARRDFESRREASVSPTPAPAPRRRTQSAMKPGKGIDLSSIAWRETPHAGGRTSGLGWGDDEPIDIMGAPGTPVGAPASGVITEHGSAKEGGRSVTILGDDGNEYWLGHIDNLPPIGSKVQAGQIVGVISPEHPRPHVHATRRRRK